MDCTDRMKLKWTLTGLAALAMAQGALSQTPKSDVSTSDLKKLSLEQLMDIPVYSASRRLEPTQSVPAAIFVLTGEDIRRAHATNIPEALRLVPGVEVGQVDANRWAVSIRGFNSREANKLLVLVDSRSIYDPLFSGTLWESQDLMLEDVDRIEVIRGPGGTLWGANAFNGVINIITRNSRDTQGGLATLTAGNEQRYIAAARYGWQTGEDQYARVYAKSYEEDEGFSSIAPPHDASRGLRGGFRWDWKNANGDRLRVSGDVFHVAAGIRQLLPPPGLIADVEDIIHRGGDLLASGTRHFSETNDVRVRFYYDRVGYDSETYQQTRDVYDIELQQNIEPLERHRLVWGVNYRVLRDDTHVDFFGVIAVEPGKRNDRIAAAFVQDTIALAPERLALTLGAKFESTDYASSEWLPNARFAWTPNPQTTWWASASRAERVPSRLEADLTFHFFGATIRPGDTFEAEHVNAYELGMRRLVGHNFWLDVATFYNRYNDLRTTEGAGNLRNFMNGDTYGAEIAARWTPMPIWRLDAAYTWLKMDLGLQEISTSNPGQPSFIAGLAPRSEASLRSALDLPHDIEFDATLRFVDDLPSLNYPSYTTLDLALSWRPRDNVVLSLAGQNLLDSPHPEQSFVFTSAGIPSEAERSVFGRVTWAF